MQEKCIQGKIYLLSIFYGVFRVRNKCSVCLNKLLAQRKPGVRFIQRLKNFRICNILVNIYWISYSIFTTVFIIVFSLATVRTYIQKKLKTCTGSIFFVFISLFNCHKMCYHKLLKFCKSPEFCRNCAFQCENCSQLF